ncbi:amino acid adenylation domain-containing protein, partial [Massilia sp. CCM 8695]
PIGAALPGRAIYLLDADMNPVPVGAAGELCIGGELLARGYHGRPDLSGERFVPDPFGAPGARMYRTGDLARWKPDGVIDYLGRIDHQVKIRGFRIELPEIEACLLGHPAVREALILVREDRPGDKRLVAYLTAHGAAPAGDTLRRHIAAQLPDYMVPSAFVPLAAMPMNPNGKLDRKALPAPVYGADSEQAAPRNASEAALVRIWCEVLGIESAGIHDNFFMLGGHSLLATRLVSRIRAELRCELPVRALFEAPTIAQLAERVQPASAADLAPIPAVPRDGALPLSFAQQRLWFLHQLEPHSAAYNMAAAVRLVGALDIGALKRAFQDIVARHEILRTTFREEGGAALQFIAPQLHLAMPLVDLSAMPSGQREMEAMRIAQAEAGQPFDLMAGPLMRLRLVKVAESGHILLMTMHHIVSDDWSMSIFTREFALLYSAALQGGRADLPPLPIQYADFAAWQRQFLSGAELDRQLAYWQGQLGTAHPVLDLPADRARPPVQSGRGAACRWTFDPALAPALRQLGQAQGTSLFMTMLAVFNVMLHRLSGQDDVRVGVPVANRNRMETESLIGFFVNTQVMRAQLDGRTTFAGLLERVKEAALGAQANQDLPFERLVEALQPERNLSHSPLFQVMFNLLQAGAAAPMALPGLVLHPVSAKDGTTQFDLALDVVERGGQLEGVLTYSTDLFEPASAARLAGYYTNLLHAVVAAPQARVGQLAMLGHDEYRQLTHDWALAGAMVDALPPVHLAFELQAAATPDAIALVCDEAQLSYAELNAQANRVAHHLIGAGITADARVGIRMERSPAMIVAILAILKAGGAYVPLDPAYPQERLAYMAHDAGIALLLDALPACGAQPTHNPALPVHGQQLAYVMYTSGSTGKPKGVAMIHAALSAHVAASRDFCALKAGERVLQFSTFSFDGFVEQLYPALTCGAAVVLRGPDLWDSEELYRRIVRHRVAVADFTTAYWFHVVQDWAVRGHADYGVLRTVSIGGEAMPPEGVTAWRSAGLSHVRLLNTYGPTEATVSSTMLDCAAYVSGDLPKPAQMPIGRALPGRAIYLLDADMNPVPVGVAGELCIGGALLARGYHGRPDLSGERFVADPFGAPGARMYRTGDLARWKPDGVIDYLGRIDHQVKIRGFRIELAEIEACLLSHPAVREALILVREDRPGDKRLVAYLTAQGDAPAGDTLRRHIAAQLPDYMVPSAFVPLAAMPMSPNGKLDRKALPAPVHGADSEQAAPRNATESALARIWCEVLGVEQAGIHDNFFMLGGHSLLATRLVSRIRSELQCELPVRALFEAPTIAQLAERVQPASADELAPIPLAPRDGALPLSFAQQRLWFLHQLEPESAAYNMPAAVRLAGELDVAALEQAFGAIVARHETLRTTFREVGGEAAQVIAAQLHIPMPLADVREEEVGALIGAEVERPFDLMRGPVLRVKLLRLSASEHVLLLVMHHIAADGWSISVLVRELGALYAAFKDGRDYPLPPLAIQYADFAAWQRKRLAGGELARQLAYWRAQLGSDHPVLTLPADRPRPAVMSGNGERYRFHIDSTVTQQLQALSRSQGASLFMTLLTVFDVWLYAQTGRRDPVVGTDIANRNRSETEGLLGFFINQLALRADLSGNPAFDALLARTRHRVLDAYTHQDLPFNKLVEAINPVRSLAYTPLFQVKLVLQNQADEALVLAGLEIRPQPLEGEQAEFDLLLVVTEMAGGLECILKYSTDLFEHATVAAFAAQLGALLARCGAEPAATLDALAHTVSSMAQETRLARQHAHSTHGLGKLQATRRKSISLNTASSLKDAQQ